MKKNKILTFGVMAMLITATMTGCKNEPSAECVELQTASKQLAANIEMYQTTWDKIINEGQIDLINETNFDKNITLAER